MNVSPHKSAPRDSGRIPGGSLISGGPYGIVGVAVRRDGIRLPCAISVAPDSHPLVVRLHGAVDECAAPFLKQRIHKALETSEARCLAIDLTYCTCLDGAGLALLYSIHRHSIPVRLVHAPSEVLQLLESTGMDKVLPVAA